MNLFNRRKFLGAAVAAGMTPMFPLSGKNKTYSPSTNSDIGKSKWDLDSPALCVDLDKMERNIKNAQASLKAYGLEARPHAKTHKCPEIAKMQVAAAQLASVRRSLANQKLCWRTELSMY